MDALTLPSLQSSPHTPEKTIKWEEKKKSKSLTLENKTPVHVQDVVKSPRGSIEFEKYPAQSVGENTY
jgi:hypothetical protein